MACGTDSEHYRQFVESEKRQLFISASFALLKGLAVFLAPKEDYERGYLNSSKAS
jgi:hypothetical protein